ncbi:sarcoplasmic calcium-binding protein-like [Mya arenaria]|uniref:sarcoplasmic calcium-binding protein-like n=1 Tax=Mya arenaria TaxID=6604 RepID=UPI0022E19D4A|nr:sarcoplasmic calcium-binding protein-like [Mya arenaria]
MTDINMLEEKWRIVFGLIDINKDGVVSIKDADSCKSTFTDMCSDPARKAQMVADLDKYWNNIVFIGESPDWSREVSQEQFINHFREVFTSDKAGTSLTVTDALRHLLAAADIDGSGIFTFDKFFKFHQAFNLAHDIVVRTTFNLIGPAPDDTCTLKQVHDFYVELFVGEDQNKFATLKNAYKAIGML